MVKPQDKKISEDEKIIFTQSVMSKVTQKLLKEKYTYKINNT